MLKIKKEREVEIRKTMPLEVKVYVFSILNILKDEYGHDEKGRVLGGYVLLVENRKEVILTKNSLLKDTLPEYTEEIICSGGVKYTSSLFLLSSDYSVVVIAEEKLSKILLEE